MLVTRLFVTSYYNLKNDHHCLQSLISVTGAVVEMYQKLLISVFVFFSVVSFLFLHGIPPFFVAVGKPCLELNLKLFAWAILWLLLCLYMNLVLILKLVV